MNAEILCVGSELLLGQIIDTNAAYMAGELSRIGVNLHRKQTVGDNLDRIVDCIRGALSRADLLVITGGLGPTTDDLTREGIAAALGVELVRHAELEEPIRALFARRGTVPLESMMRQAYLPAGANALPNSNGTAPGVWAQTSDGKMIFAVPGVPKEMKVMLQLSIIPAILEHMEGERSIIVSRVLRTTGIGESALAEPLEDILTTATNPTAAPLIFGNTEVHIRLTAKATNPEEAKTLLDGLEAQIRERAGEHIFGIDDDTIASVVIRTLRERGQTLAVAESVTGGVVAQMLTDVPGSSDVFLGGVVTYSNEAKANLLGVSSAVIQEHTAVSAPVATAMAEGALRKFGADFALSTTGEAGPQAATDKPVGTVFIGLAGGKDSGDHTEFSGSQLSIFGDRDAIRRRTAMNALNILRRHLLETNQAV
jgi:nicotinamide-nucleotide amidase